MSAKTWVPHFIVVHLGSRGNYFQDENIQLFANSYHLKGSLISRMAEIEL